MGLGCLKVELTVQEATRLARELRLIPTLAARALAAEIERATVATSVVRSAP